MSKRNVTSIASIDVFTFCIYLSLVGVGWLMIFTVDYKEISESTLGFFEIASNVRKQTIWIGVSLLIVMVLQFIDWKFWRVFAYPIYALGILALILVLIFGKEVNGATSWFNIFGFTLQPSEFVKFTTCVAIAGYLSTYKTNLKNWQSIFTAAGLFLLPSFLILLQPDAGSSLVLFSFLIVFYRAGLSVNFYIVGAVVSTFFILGLIYQPLALLLGMIMLSCIILIFKLKNKTYFLLAFAVLSAVSVYLLQLGYLLPVLGANVAVFIGLGSVQFRERNSRFVYQISSLLVISTAVTFAANIFFNSVLEKHQQERINVWLQPSKCDKQGALYNVLQSKMAIGSGGFEGKGFLQGNMTKLNYVPEQTTDFIFCTVGEEQGFIGTLGIVGLFLLLILRIVMLAERQRSDFSKYYAYGVAGILFTHFFVNIGMTMGLVPIIGIPLPFISYGGSSLMGFSLLIGVLLRLDSYHMQS